MGKMNHEQRRQLRKTAVTRLKKTKGYALIYLDDEMRLQCIGDVNVVPEDTMDPSLGAMGSMYNEGMMISQRVRGQHLAREAEALQADKVEKAKGERSKVLAAESGEAEGAGEEE